MAQFGYCSGINIGGIDSYTKLMLHGDSYGIDDYTKLMLHMNGTDGSTTFIDSSYIGRTVNVNGQAQIDTAQSKFGGASGLFNGSGAYLTLADSDDWYFGTGDFTIDAWVMINTLPSNGNALTVISQWYDWSNYWWLHLYNNNGTYNWKFIVRNGGTLTINPTTSSSTVNLTQWYHIALVRRGTTFNIYLDGTSIGSDINSNTIPDFANVMSVGYLGGGYHYFNGWLDEVRVSKGIARWTSNFTPPTQEYYAIIDSEITPKTATLYGNVISVTTQKKFGNSSIYFDGTGDYITFPDSEDWYFGSGDFTIDCWVRFNTLPADLNVSMIYNQYVDSSHFIFFGLHRLDASYGVGVYKWIFQQDDGGIFPIDMRRQITISAGQWYHIVILRTGTSFQIYQDGVKQGNDEVVDITLPNLAGSLLIGRHGDGNHRFAGYIDEYRISKGIARWTSNFTPPIAPYTK